MPYLTYRGERENIMNKALSILNALLSAAVAAVGIFAIVTVYKDDEPSIIEIAPVKQEQRSHIDEDKSTIEKILKIDSKKSTADDDSDDSTTIGKRNAKKSAKSYISALALSRTQMIEQLEFEGYTTEEATYGADNCGADWNVEAAECAENLLDVMGMSRSQLAEQLEFVGFTDEQIEYALEKVGY